MEHPPPVLLMKFMHDSYRPLLEFKLALNMPCVGQG